MQIDLEKNNLIRLNFKMEKFIIILIILIAFVFFTAGFLYGCSYTIKWVAHYGMRFIEMNGIKLDIDEQSLQTAIIQYKNNIGGCLFTQNLTK